MKVLLCIALLVVAQTMGFSVKSDIDFDNIQAQWSEGSLGPNDPILRTRKGVPSQPIENDGKIINPTDAGDPHNFPWSVGLFMNGNTFCTGSIIAPQWILTAAHCQQNRPTTVVHIGAYNVRNSSNYQQTVPGTGSFPHRLYNANTLANDIALIKLPAPIDFNAAPRPIATIPYAAANPGADIYPVGTECQIAGWGTTTNGGSISNTLNWGTVRTISNAECAGTYGSIIQPWFMCTTGGSTSGAQGTCSGDSGSAITAMVGTPAVRTQIGVTSFVSSLGCNSGNPDGFTSVAYYRDWIEQTMAEN